jgi:transposase
MAKPLSIDLRERIVSAVAAGGTIREVAARFQVAPSAVSKISSQYRKTGCLAPRAMGGDRRSHVIEADGERILGVLRDRPDATLPELRAALREEGIVVGHGGLCRLLARRRISFKKNPARQRAGSP